MRRCIGSVVLLMTSAAAFAAAPPARGFTDAEAKRLSEIETATVEYALAGRFAKADALAREERAWGGGVWGRDQGQTKAARRFGERWRRLAKLPQDQREAAGRALERTLLGSAARQRGRYREAERLYREALTI